MPGQYNVPLKDDAGDNIFYGCILQRVKCVYHLARPRIELADLFCSHSLIQVLPWQFFIHQWGRKLTHMRYSAATGSNGFTLHRVQYDPPPSN